MWWLWELLGLRVCLGVGSRLVALDLGLVHLEVVLVVVLADVCEAADGAILPFCWADMGDLAVPLAFFAILADLCRRVVRRKEDGEC